MLRLLSLLSLLASNIYAQSGGVLQFQRNDANLKNGHLENLGPNIVTPVDISGSNHQNEHIPSINASKPSLNKETTSMRPPKLLTGSPAKSENGIIKTSVDADTEPQVESGAVIRGICVMVGLSFIFILYLGIKNYSKKNPKTAIVRKYGVKTRRNDVEMEPLPLSEDEDETLFDLGRINNRQ